MKTRPKRIHEVTTEKQFLSFLRRFYRASRRRGYRPTEISFLGLMETTGAQTREFEWWSAKYFGVGPGAWDWSKGNSLLKECIVKWENEIREGK